MQLTLPQLDFTISLNACHDEIMHKMEVLTNLEIQLLRKFEYQLSNSELHYEMIHDVRVLIVNLQQVYKDVKQYFNQMGIQFVYDFFRKIQVLMVCGYNFISQALLVNVERVQDHKNKQPLGKGNMLNCKICKCTCPQNSKHKKRQIRQAQQYDYKISMLQNQQKKLASQIQTIYEKMMMQKSMIERTKPSLAVRQLQDMKEHIQNVMQSTNSIFQQTYMMKYVEFKDSLAQIKKPEDIVDYFVTNMNFNMKEKFLKAMQKATYKAQHMEQRIQRRHLKDIEVQTDKIKQPGTERDSVYRGFSLKPQKNQSLLTKQRKYNQKIMSEVQYLKKQMGVMVTEQQKIRKQGDKKQAERLKFKQNYETLQQLYNKRAFQLENSQTEKKWLLSEKQNQSKKLRNQIKQLKRDQVQTSAQQTQTYTYIKPNCINMSTETEIIYFQNEIDNEIINVLKKSNQKMIFKLNEQQKKIKQLKTQKGDNQMLRQTKVILVSFLSDLREVTTYKMDEFNKQNKKYLENANKKSIIALNKQTSNAALLVTIEKLAEQIKTLLLSENKSKIRSGQTENRRGSFTYKNKTIAVRENRQSQKMSQYSDQSIKTRDNFFKNSMNKRNDFASLSLQNQVGFDNMPIKTHKKSIFKEQAKQNRDNRSQSSQTQNEEVFKKSNRSYSTSRKSVQHPSGNKIVTLSNRRTSNIEVGFRNDIVNLHNKTTLKQISCQTDILKSRKSKNYNRNQTFIHYSDFIQQTQIQGESFAAMYKFYQQKKQINGNQSNYRPPYQSFSTRKHPYLRKPGGMQRFTTDRSHGPENNRNYVSVNHSLATNQKQISQLIHDQINKSKWDDLPNDQIPFDNHQNINKSSSNATLESRLSALVSTKNPSASRGTSGLIVFKTNNQNYEKRSSQMVFDELEINKITLNDKQKRNASFNSYKNDSFLLNSKNTKNQFNQMLNKIQYSNDNQKQKTNIYKNQNNLKSNFVQKIVEQDENYSNTLSNYGTLIEVCKQTPMQRQKTSPTRLSREPHEVIFQRAVRQMLLSSQSKENLMQKMQDIYFTMEKQRQNKKIKKILKGAYTPRNSHQRREEKSKQTVELFKLGEILY